MVRISENRQALTPEERLRAAFGHLVLNVPQQDVAMIMAINIGRVSEACQAVRLAIEDPVDVIAKLTRDTPIT